MPSVASPNCVNPPLLAAAQPKYGFRKQHLNPNAAHRCHIMLSQDNNARNAITQTAYVLAAAVQLPTGGPAYAVTNRKPHACWTAAYAHTCEAIGYSTMS